MESALLHGIFSITDCLYQLDETKKKFCELKGTFFCLKRVPSLIGIIGEKRKVFANLATKYVHVVLIDFLNKFL